MRYKPGFIIHATLATFAVLVFVTSARAAQTKTLHSFNRENGDAPTAGLVMDAAHNLYGTTSSGGPGFGTVFELSPDGQGGWKETVLMNLGGPTGGTPYAGLIFDGAGNLYGTASSGGENGLGAVFELSPAGGGTWTFKVLYSFGGLRGADGARDVSGLTMDAAGNLYGTTALGGLATPYCHDGCGTVFELSHDGSNWKENVLYRFHHYDGFEPQGGVIFDKAGNLYGTTRHGAHNESGTAYKLVPKGSGEWDQTVLHAFDNGDPAGVLPLAGLLFDGMGNLYGTASEGGSSGKGTAFELSPNDSGEWTAKPLHSFGGKKDGQSPAAALIFDQAGNLYGTTPFGGANFWGMVFELSPDGSGGWRETVLTNFTGQNGGWSMAPLIQDAAGNFYGTASAGGETDHGVVFEVIP